MEVSSIGEEGSSPQTASKSALNEQTTERLPKRETQPNSHCVLVLFHTVMVDTCQDFFQILVAPTLRVQCEAGVWRDTDVSVITSNEL